jgi:hypothetical protein
VDIFAAALVSRVSAFAKHLLSWHGGTVFEKPAQVIEPLKVCLELHTYQAKDDPLL